MVRRSIARALRVEPGEGVRVAGLFALFACLAVAYVLTQSGGYALFVQRYGTDDLKYAYLLAAVAVSGVAGAHLVLARRLALGRLVVLDVAVMLVVAVLVRVGVAGGSPAVLFALPVWEAAINNLANVVVWSLAGRLLDVRQSKRLSGVIAAGRSLALTAGGLSVPLLVGIAGPRGLLTGAAVLVAAAAAVLLALLRHERVRIGEPASVTRLVTRDRGPRGYLRLIVTLVFTSMGCYLLVKNVFYDRSAARYPSDADFASVVGAVAALQGGATLLCSLFVTGRAFDRFGLKAGLFVMPFTMVAIYAPLAVLGSLDALGPGVYGLAIVGVVSASISLHGLRTPAVQVLYQPLPPVVRARVSALAGGVVEPLAMGFAGASLLLVGALTPVTFVGASLVVVGLALTLALVATRTTWDYPAALRAALARRFAAGGNLDLSDASSGAALRESLRSDHPETVIASLGLLERSGADLDRLVPDLLAHPAPAVQVEALERIRQRRLEAAAPAVRAVLDSTGDDAVHAAALHALAVVDLAGAERALRAGLGHHSPAVRRAALLGLGSRTWNELAAATLDSWARAGDAALRADAAAVVGDLTAPTTTAVLHRLLDDPDHGVRRLAVESAGRRADAGSVPALVDAIGEVTLRSGAASALERCGAAAVPHLAAALHRPSSGWVERAPLIRTLGRIGGPEAVTVLVPLAADADPRTRGAAVRALARARWRDRDRSALAAAWQVEVDTATTHLAAAAALEPFAAREPMAMLVGELAALRRFDADRLLGILVLGERSPGLERARETLSSDRGGPARAYALEVVATTLDAEARALVLALLDDLLATEALRRLPRSMVPPVAGPERWLEFLSTSPIPVLASSARLVAEHRAGRGTEDLVLSRVGLLRTVTMFSTLTSDVLADLARTMATVRLVAGEVLFGKGDDGDTMYVVASGELEVSDGDRVLDRCPRGRAVGELAVLDPAPRSATVRALGPTTVERLDGAVFQQLLIDHPELAGATVRSLLGLVRTRTTELDVLRRRLVERDEAASAVPAGPLASVAS